MPFLSQAQRAKFYADPALRKYIPEFEAATGNKKLPEHVQKAKPVKAVASTTARRPARPGRPARRGR